jgi:hypothetical protein
MAGHLTVLHCMAEVKKQFMYKQFAVIILEYLIYLEQNSLTLFEFRDLN